MSCYVIAVWICIGLSVNEGEQVFMHLLAFFRSSWEKSLCPSFAQVFISLFFFLVETCELIVSLGFSTLVRCELCKHPLSVVVLSLHGVDGFLDWAEASAFEVVLFVSCLL